MHSNVSRHTLLFPSSNIRIALLSVGHFLEVYLLYKHLYNWPLFPCLLLKCSYIFLTKLYILYNKSQMRNVWGCSYLHLVDLHGHVDGEEHLDGVRLSKGKRYGHKNHTDMNIPCLFVFNHFRSILKWLVCQCIICIWYSFIISQSLYLEYRLKNIVARSMD